MYESWDNPLGARVIEENYQGRSTPVFVLAIITLLLSIAGLVMSASGVPWYYDNGEINDYEECCSESYQNNWGVGGTEMMLIAPMTTVFVLLICFSIPLISLFFIPMKRWLRIPLNALFGLAILTNSIFMLRRFAFMMSAYLEDLERASLNDSTSSLHLHVMPYFLFLTSIIALVLGLIIIKSIRPNGQKRKSLERASFNFLRTCLIASISILFLNPVIPLANDTSSEENDFIYQFTGFMAVDYSYSGDEVDDSFGNHMIAENMIIVIVWICLSLLLIMSLYGIPKMKEIVNGITQLSALILVFIVIAVVFSILFYVNLHELDSDLYPHANWLIPVGCLIMLGSWISFLISSHIPWWKQISTRSNSLQDATQLPKQYPSGSIITCPNCKIQIDTSLNR